jgi:acetate kinase
MSPGYPASPPALHTGSLIWLLSQPLPGLRIITCHLGAGASLAAVLGGRSVDTTMGFTPLEGLVMATRSGTVDPGLVLWLEQHEHLTPLDVATALESRSGLLALAGTSDMREVEAAAERGDPDARLGSTSTPTDWRAASPP